MTNFHNRVLGCAEMMRSTNLGLEVSAQAIGVLLRRPLGARIPASDFIPFGGYGFHLSTRYGLGISPARVASLLCRKYEEYGPNTFDLFGAQGILVRLGDKWQRAEKLEGDGARSEIRQALLDTADDMIGYAVCGFLFADGEWHNLTPPPGGFTVPPPSPEADFMTIISRRLKGW